MAPTEGTYVKWQTPTDELLGIAKAVNHLVKEQGLLPRDVRIAVPNRIWAAQAQRACESVGVDAALCVPPARIGAAAATILAQLALVADATDEEARATCGCTPQQAIALAQEHAGSRGYSLAHALKVDKTPEFAQALAHIDGDEDAAGLAAVLKKQLAHPTPSNDKLVAIVDFRAVEPGCTWLFMAGCVDGLVPAGSDEALVQADRTAFQTACACPTQHLVISGFATIPLETALKAKVRVVRRTREKDIPLAVTAPTPFLDEMGDDRPATVGGQTFLNTFDLN